MARLSVREWAVWLPSFLAFPPAGLAGRGVAGDVDGAGAALAGGAVTGLVLGTGQALLARHRLPGPRWVAATAVGYALGLALGAAAVGYRTSLAALVLQGALTGAVVGLAQAVALGARTPARARLAWAGAAPLLWAGGWAVTTAAGVDVESRYTVFGATGALTFTVLAGLLLAVLPERREPVPAARREARR